MRQNTKFLFFGGFRWKMYERSNAQIAAQSEQQRYTRSCLKLQNTQQFFVMKNQNYFCLSLNFLFRTSRPGFSFRLSNMRQQNAFIQPQMSVKYVAIPSKTSQMIDPSFQDCQISLPTYPGASHPSQIERLTLYKSNKPSFEKIGSLDAEL